MREPYVLSRGGGGWSIAPRAEGMKNVEKKQGLCKLSFAFALILGVGETSQYLITEDKSNSVQLY